MREVSSPLPVEARAGLARRRWILAALMMTMMLAAMDTTIVSTAIPQVVADLGGFALFSWVFSIYLLAQTVTIPVYGKLADVLGRKPVVVAGTLLFLVGSAACAAADGMVSLVVYRGLQGLGAGSIMATVNTLAGDLYEVRERARVQGWLSSVWGIAAIAGPTLGGALAQYSSWRWIFLINLPIGIGALLLLAGFLHERPQRRVHRIDYPGALLTLLAGGLLVFALLQGGQAWPWLSVPGLAVLAATAGAIAALLYRERVAAEPIMPAWLWRDRTLATGNLAMIGMGLVMMAPSTYLPTLGQSVLELGAILSGLLLASISVGWPVASALSGWAYGRFGFRDAGLAGAVLMALAVAAFLAGGYPGNLAWLFVVHLLLGAGFGLLSTPVLVAAQSKVGWDGRGAVTGANIFSRYLGQSLGAAVFGAIFNHGIAVRLAAAPAALREALPREVDAVPGALEDPHLAVPAGAYLRHAMHDAVQGVYLGALVIAIVTVLVVLATPRDEPPVRK